MENNIPCETYFHHTGFYVTDIDKSVAWYKEMLGFEKMFENIFPLTEGPTRMCWIKKGNFYIELSEHNPPLQPFSMDDYLEKNGAKHICMYVKDGELEKLNEHLAARGANFMVRDWRWPREICGKPNGCGVTFVFDPDGIPIEIQEEYTPGEY